MMSLGRSAHISISATEGSMYYLLVIWIGGIPIHFGGLESCEEAYDKVKEIRQIIVYGDLSPMWVCYPEKEWFDD